MIEIDSSLLSESALENLILEVIGRHTISYDQSESSIQMKKDQLVRKIKNGSAKIVFQLLTIIVM